MSGQKIAYVVPTKDRPVDLRKLLESLRKQTVAPSQIVIVDASDPAIESLCAEYTDLPLTYVREFPPSLARQRNAGMAALHDEITVAGYLDDDLELADDATEQMIRFWEEAGADVGGAAFAIVNQPQRHSILGLFANFFLLNSNQQGRVLASGFASSIGTPVEDIKTEWLYGGATLWRREVINSFSYDEWYIGHGYLEDVDYSYRVSRSYNLWVVSKARVWHWPHPVLLAKNEGLGKQQIVNRLYFVRKMGGFSKVLLVWALMGQGILNLLQSAKARDASGLYRFYGNLKGLGLLLSGHKDSAGGVWK